MITQPRRNPGAARRAFSFLEIMLVVMIIGIMLAVIGPNLVGKSQKAKISATKMQVRNIAESLGLYEQAQGSFPTTEQGLEALVTRPSDVSEETWERCMKEIPLDAWKQPFKYTCPGENDQDYDIVSAGPDRKMGTEDDISNAPKSKPGSNL